MAVPHKYQAKEVLNKVLNSGEDALKVDIDNVTLTTEGGDVAIEVHLDKAEDSVLMFSNTSSDGSGTSYVPLVDSSGHLQVDALSSALPSGAATAANQSTIIGHVDGLETLITSTNSKIDTLDAVQDNALTKLGEIETTNNANQVLLGTIDSDTNETKTALNNMLYGTAVAITAVDGGSNQDIESGATYEALYIGVGGDVTVTLATDTEDILFKNLASGQLLPIRLTDVKASNTTATYMIALKA